MDLKEANAETLRVKPSCYKIPSQLTQKIVLMSDVRSSREGYPVTDYNEQKTNKIIDATEATPPKCTNPTSLNVAHPEAVTQVQKHNYHHRRVLSNPILQNPQKITNASITSTVLLKIQAKQLKKPTIQQEQIILQSLKKKIAI